MAGETARWYPNGQKHFQAGSVDWDAHTIKFALLTSASTYNPADEFFDDVNANEVVGTGYTAGGTALASKTNVVTLAASAAAWAADTPYVQGDVVRAVSSNGHVFRCTTAGTSDSTEPTWNVGTLRETAEVGAVNWVEFGAAIIVLDAANPEWPDSSIEAWRGVVYRDTGAAATSQLLGFVDFNAAKISTDGTFEVRIDDRGILRVGSGSTTANP